MEYGDALPMAVPNTSIMAQQHKSEIEAMVDTAHKYPRNIVAFLDEAEAMATTDPETAADMFYSLKRKGKNNTTTAIEGFSIRLAEIVACAYKNLRYGARIVEVSATTITAQAFCFDLEKNTGTTLEVQRRITYKNGDRFSDDMIIVTGNAACSIALRNAIAKVVPRAYIDKIYRRAMEVANGQAVGLDVKRQEAIGAIQKAGVSVDRILATLGRSNIKEVTWSDINDLRGYWNAAKDGIQTLEEIFPEITDEEEEDDKPKKTAKGAAAKAKEALKTEPKAEEPQAPPVKEPEKAKTEPAPPADNSDLKIPALNTPELQKFVDGWDNGQAAQYDDTFANARQDGLSTEHAHEQAFKAAMGIL